VLCCVLQLLTPNNLGGTWRRICSPDIRNVSALEVLRNCALQIDIYLLTYLHSHKHTYVSSSYKWTRTCWFRFSVCFCMLFFTMVCLSKFWFKFLCVLFCMLFFTRVCLSRFWFRFSMCIVSWLLCNWLHGKTRHRNELLWQRDVRLYSMTNVVSLQAKKN